MRYEDSQGSMIQEKRDGSTRQAPVSAIPASAHSSLESGRTQRTAAWENFKFQHAEGMGVGGTQRDRNGRGKEGR